MLRCTQVGAALYVDPSGAVLGVDIEHLEAYWAALKRTAEVLEGVPVQDKGREPGPRLAPAWS
jgi:hypothetical protein